LVPKDFGSFLGRRLPRAVLPGRPSARDTREV
jgi:hypothetical protein